MYGKLEIKGLEELSEKIRRAIKEFPLESEEKLEQMGKDLKKRVVDLTPKGPTGKLRKSYRLSKVKQQGSHFYIEFWSTAPHFHLIERGHAIKNAKGEIVGRVEGYRMVESGVKLTDEKYKEEIEKWLEDLFKECK